MSILDFQKPDEVVMINEKANQGNFEFRPLEPGYGLTVGNALRRVLLSSLEGYAIISIRIEGVDHEFSTVEGVVQDTTEIILNLKQVRFKQQIDSVESEVATLKVSKSNVVTAADLASSLSNFQVLNPEQVICELNKKVTFEMEFTITKGRGYVPAEENEVEDAPIGTIAIDSIFTPIKNVNYNIEDYRVGQKTDFEKLNLNITTDG
jgi:DNA-directed RNA polymerase subunit alpha